MLKYFVCMLYPSFAVGRGEQIAISDDTDDKKNRQHCAEPELNLTNQRESRVHLSPRQERNHAPDSEVCLK